MAFVLSLGCSTTQAQTIEAGAELSYLRFGELTSHVGLGAKVFYLQSEKNTFYGGVSYFLKSSYQTSVYGNAIIDFTEPFQISIDGENSVSVIQINVGARRSVVGLNDDDYNLYVAGEASFSIIPIKTTLEDFNDDLYLPTSEDGSKETLTGFHIGIGFGGEKKFGNLSLYAEGMFNFAANEANGAAIEVKIPGFLSASVGIKIPIVD